MCRYRYHYFSGCKHQQSILSEFCSDAIAIHELQAVASSEHDGQNSTTQQAATSQPAKEGAPGCDNTDLPSLCSTARTHSSHSNRSSLDKGSVFIIAEPRFDCTSLQSDHHPLTHSSTQAESSHDMAGLPLFGGTFRQWMSGGSSPIKHTTVVDSIQELNNAKSMESLQPRELTSPMIYARSRPEGIRERTDESCDLPRSNDIMQHLAEAHRNSDAHNGLEWDRVTSYGTACTLNEFKATRHAYDSIEAEIDQLKEDVMRLREGSEQDIWPPVRNAWTKSSSIESIPESAASRLQKQHDAQTNQRGIDVHDRKNRRQLLSPVDFPALDGGKPDTEHALPAEGVRSGRKFSYADAAGATAENAAGHTLTVATMKRLDTMKLREVSHNSFPTTTAVPRTQTSSTAATQDSDEYRESDDRSVIISSQSVKNHSPTNGKPIKQAPHFAQPTQSFSRRTGDTLRGPASPASPRDSPGGSPTKATKAKEPSLATDQRATQRQKKRKSLPGDWLGGTDQNPARRAADVSVKTTTSSPSAEVSQKAEDSYAHFKATTIRAKAKETYARSPARTISKCSVPSIIAAPKRTRATQKPEHLRIRPNLSSPAITQEVHGMPDSQRCSTASSEASFVQFILEKSHQPATLSRPSESQSPQLLEQHRQIASQARVPGVETSPDQMRKERSPSKLPKPSHQVQHPVQIAVQAVDDPFKKPSTDDSSLPVVANTVLKRRTSNGHILTPILARLDANNVLKKPSTDTGMFGSRLKGHLDYQTTNATSSSVSGVAAPLNGPYNSNSGVRSSKVVKGRTQSAPTGFPAGSNAPATLVAESVVSVPAHSTPGILNLSLANLTPGFGSIYNTSDEASSEGKSFRSSSLRATANEFKPMKHATDTWGPYDVRGALEWKSTWQWSLMSPVERHAVQNLRVLYGDNGTSSSTNMTTDHPQMVRSKPSDECLFPNKSAHQLPMISAFKTVDENGSPNVVQPGQKLIPTLSPGKKAVKWLLQDTDGKETPIKFGRAPPPIANPIFDSFTPPISPTSNDTSPPTTSNSLRGWHIGSAYSAMPYGWTGGDGKEIRFVGYGPHAERDPNSVVNFNFQGHMARYNTATPNGFDEEKENRSAEARVAPRSQRQWVEKLGYRKAPCGNVEITQAVEHCIPFGSELAAYCFDCMAR